VVVFAIARLSCLFLAQQHFTTLEVAEDWHKLMILQLILREGTSNTIHVTIYLHPNSMQPALDIYSMCYELVNCGCNSQQSRSKEGLPTLLVS